MGAQGPDLKKKKKKKKKKKELRLRMFESEAGPGEKVEDDAVRRFEHGHVTPRWRD